MLNHAGRMVAKVVLGAMVVAVVGPVGVADADPSSPALPSNCSLAGTTVTCAFSYTGAEQTFVVPAGPSELTMDLRGASGGIGGTGDGGRGGVASQSLSIGAGSDSEERIHAGQTLYVEVGGAGSNYAGPGGFNGGGTGASGGAYGGGGGGASDIRALPRTTALTVSDTRLIVAGGGGGGGNCGNGAGNSDGGGAGQPGRAPCGNGAVPGGGATGTGGSATAPATAGVLGQGGAASGAAGGGGGGLYGGGGGLGGGGGSFMSAGGGGGSSWTVEADGTTGLGFTAGHGAVTISYVLAAQQITFPALSADARVGTSVVLAATGGGSGQPVTFSLDPTTTNDACVVAGDPDDQTVSFQHVGDCVIAADQAGDGGHVAATTVTRTIPVVAGAQSITFTTTAPSAAAVAGTYRPEATGGGSGAVVVFSIDPTTTNNACSITGTPDGPDGQVVSFDRAGVCVVAADQAGSDDYAAASSMTQSIPVSLATSSVGVTLASGQVVYGQPAEATVVGDRAGSVQLLVDGVSTGPAVSVSPDRPTTLSVTAPGGAPVAPGAHSVEVVLTPADTDLYAGSRASTPLTVSPAATTTRLRVSTEALVATVTPQRSMVPGAAAPSGIVTFSLNGERVGQAPLIAVAGGATATLPRRVPAGQASAVSAAYAGDERFTGSSASTSRDNPAILATVVTSKSSSGRKGPDWYRSPVTVRFRCTTTTAPLIKPCPSPVTLRHNGAGQAVTRTITATDGGTDTVTVSGINIDRAAPRVRVAGVREGASYFGAQPSPSCRATDRLSGIASCSVSRRRAPSADGTNHKVRYRAVAIDVAGNRTVVRGRYTEYTSFLEGAKLVRGRFLVAPGGSYRLVVTDSSVRPTYYLAELAPRRPHARGMAMYPAGRRQWALTIRIDEGMSGRDWNLGIETGGKMASLRLRVRG